MPISIKNDAVDAVLEELVEITGETKTEAIRLALVERRNRLAQHPGRRLEQIRTFLETEIWPLVPADELGRELSKPEEDEILGYGPAGI